jgi:hypothetical protein
MVLVLASQSVRELLSGIREVSGWNLNQVKALFSPFPYHRMAFDYKPSLLK